jgi:hypothetical protein
VPCYGSGLPELLFSKAIQVLDLEDLAAYKIDYSGVDEISEGSDISLKGMVGASGFEPPASWSRTRFQGLLKSMEFC